MMFDRSLDDAEVATARNRLRNAVTKAIFLQVSKLTKAEFSTHMETASGGGGLFTF